MQNLGELPKVVFVLGPPGCGKGTQCIKLAKNLGLRHLSAGELLRNERNREGSQYGQIIESHIRNGTIVPVEITCKLLENAMNDCLSAKAFLIDGFPRNQDNVEGWERAMLSKAKVLFVLYLHCPDDICVKRCLNRNEGRSDDNEESLRKRIKTYYTQTMPIIEYYKAKNLVRQVSATAPADEVYEEVEKIFKNCGI
ncbi:UMP-CMP kinase [Wuchereria bancrofti]|uniref:UMP-CMP kinase n=1 Tax=Wuchereria bancrofti TaxID=6293 RepID=J9ETG6_WUCBA|nr:UMP-CMP kinase [Wuchereria bancrofti]